MFYGESTVAIDDKGRLAIPTSYREQLSALCANRLVVTYNPFERECLWVFPLPEWERTRDQVMQLSSFNTAHRDLQRKLVGAAARVELDGNGRIVLPHTARQVAGLQKQGVPRTSGVIRTVSVTPSIRSTVPSNADENLSCIAKNSSIDTIAISSAGTLSVRLSVPAIMLA